MSDILRKAIIGEVTVGSWGASVKDKTVTKDTQERLQMSDDSGKWIKQLIAKDALDKRTKFESRVRKFVYENSLPWGKGQYLLLTDPPEHFDKWQRAMDAFAGEDIAFKEEFGQLYPGLKEEARKNLNGSFRETDYPADDKVLSKFYFKVRYFPIPTAESFQNDVSASILDSLKGQLSNEVTSMLDDAKAKMWERMYEVSKKMVDALGPADKVFRDSLIENVKQLVESLRVLNFDKDPEIEAMRARIEERLSAVDPEELRVKGRSLSVTEEENRYRLRESIVIEARAIAGDIGRRLSIE